MISIVSNPRQYKIPDWFLNRQKDNKDGKYSQVTSNGLENKLREDMERLKKIRAHRGLRHYWGWVLVDIFKFFDRFFCLSIDLKIYVYWILILIFFVLKSPCSRSTHENHWQTRPNCRCVEEEGQVDPYGRHALYFFISIYVWRISTYTHLLK